MTRTASAVVAGLLWPLLACSEDLTPPPRYVPATRVLTPAERAAAAPAARASKALSRSRCQRELWCGNVGSGRRFPTSAECVAELEHIGYSELRLDHCGVELDAERLKTCLATVEGEACQSPLEEVHRITRCRSAVICPNHATPSDQAR